MKISGFSWGVALALLLSAACVVAHPQSADQAWLKYNPLVGSVIDGNYEFFRPRVLGGGATEQWARDEIGGYRHFVNSREARWLNQPGHGLILGTSAEFKKFNPRVADSEQLGPGGYRLKTVDLDGQPTILIEGGDEPGVLYGVFGLIRRMAGHPDLGHLNVRERPVMPIRWVDEWDNPDGSIERGYAGRSIFFEGGKIREDLFPVMEYARLLASVGINGCNLNNVNAAPELLDSDHLKQLARVADAMRPWGVRLALSVDVASPQKIGGLGTFDPLDPAVKAWWTAKVNEIYALIPDFAGFTVKADSEGQPGPASFGRTPADAANTLAAALVAHGGVVLYRAFVYDHHLDWRDPKADRARAAYDIFHPLDGKFAANVIVQTKEGPIDFQAREPVSPLFAGLDNTSQAMELQITQEYTGQQRHMVYLAPMWKLVLDTDLRGGGGQTPVRKILARKGLGGLVGVAGVGRDGWLASPLALANLYAFARLAWDPELMPEEIAGEWVRQTFGSDSRVQNAVVKMLMQSWPAYENYTGPLAMQTLTDITGSHYGPGVESSEGNGWGQWHRADKDGVGMDRTVATGTGYAGQYPAEIAKVYESVESCPDELLLFFHHVPYTHRLHSGKTVIQHIYDSHYDGAARAAQAVEDWRTLRGKIEPALFADVQHRLEYQAGHAIVWRDAVVQYFFRLSGIPDERGRAGTFPGRLEAEDARLDGYRVVEITPWEDASRGKAVTCGEALCSAEWTFAGAAGRFDLAVDYFDLTGGAAQFTLMVNGRTARSWTADAALPSKQPTGDNSTRFTARGVELKPGDVLRVEGRPDGDDPAALDYLEIATTRAGR